MTAKRKKLLIVSIPLGLLLIAQIVTYALLHENSMPKAGIRSLHRAQLLLHAPYAWLGEESLAKMSAGQKATFLREIRNHVDQIYYDVAELPEGEIFTEPIIEPERDHYAEMLASPDCTERAKTQLLEILATGQRPSGLRKGMKITWRLKSSGLFWMTCRTAVWVGGPWPGASEGRTDTFIWVLGSWVRVRGGLDRAKEPRP